MSWVGILLLVVGAYLAYKLVGALLKILMLAVALVGAYWFIAPYMGWPTVSELVYVLGPDFDGRRIEDMADPAQLAKAATDRVVDGVVDDVAGRIASPEPVGASAAEPLPEPLPEDPVPPAGN